MLSLKRSICAILIVITNSFCFSQVNFQSFIEETDSQVKAEIAIELWDYYTRNNVDTLRLIGNELLTNTDELGVLGRAVGNRVLGAYYTTIGDFNLGFDELRKSEKKFLDIGAARYLSETYNLLGNSCLATGYYKSGLIFFYRSIYYGLESIDKTDSYNGLLGLGKSYCVIGDTLLGVSLVSEYLKKSVSDSKNEASADAFAYLAQICKEQGEQELSQSLYQMSIKSAKKSLSRTHIANGLNNQAIVHFERGQYDSSLFCFHESLNARIEVGKVKAISESYFNLGSFFWGINTLDSAEYYFRTTYKYASKNELQGDVVDALEDLLGLYTQLNYEEKMNRTEKELKLARERLKERANLDNEMLFASLDFSQESKENDLVNNSILEVFGVVLLVVLSLLFLYKDRPNLA